MKLTYLLGVAVISASAWARPASAQALGSQKAMATQAFEEAEQLMAKGKFAEACPKYIESQRLDFQLGTLLHIGECFERAGKTASAWAVFKEAVEVAAQRKDGRGPEAKARVAALESKVPRLIIAVSLSAPQNIEVLLDGQRLGRALWGSPLPADPGTHTITAKREGFADWSGTVELPLGPSHATVSIPDLQPLGAEGASNAGPRSNSGDSASGTDQAMSTTEPFDRGAVARIAGYVLGGVGLVGLGVGGFFALRMHSTLSDRDVANACSASADCTPADATRVGELTSEARDHAKAANIGLVVGGVAIAVGGVLVFTSYSVGPRAAPVRGALAPWVDRDGAGVLVRTGF